MKYFLPLFIAAVLITSCGGEDKKAKLEGLKQTQTELAAEIKTLEAEIAAEDTTQKSEKIKDVLITEVQPALFRHFIDVQGSVDADESIDLMPLFPGKYTRVLVKEGDAVKSGQLLAEIDHDAASKQINSLKPQLELAQDMYKRQQRLWDQKIGSEMQLLQAKTAKEGLEKQMEYYQEQIDEAYVKSPINGTVDYVGARVGQESMGSSIRIVNLTSLKVKSNIAESYASKVKKGNNVLLHFPDLNQDVESQVTFTASTIDPLKRTFTAEASLPGDNSSYHPNMVAIMKIIDYENKAAITIPINTIQTSGNEQFVYVAEVQGNKTVTRKKVVTLGSTYDGKAEILTGLNANDKVVTTGQLDLVDGIQIKF